MTISKLINDCKDKYKENYRYFLVGSMARGEKNPKDIDIIVYPSYYKLNYLKEWKQLLKKMDVKIGKKRVDAQIVPEFYLVLNNEWQNADFNKYVFTKGKIDHRVAPMINETHKKQGYTKKFPFVYEEL